MGNYFKDDLIETRKDGFNVYGEVDKNGKPCGCAIISKEGKEFVAVTEDYTNHCKNGITFVRNSEKDFHIAKYENDMINGVCLERKENLQSISFRKNGILDGVVMYFPNSYSGDIIFALYDNNVFTGKVIIYQKEVSKPYHRRLYYDLRMDILTEKFAHTAMIAECLQAQNSPTLNLLSSNFEFTDNYSYSVIDNNLKGIFPKSTNLKTVGYVHCTDGSKYISEFYKGRPNENFCKREPNGVETYGYYYELLNDFNGVKYYPESNRYIFYNLTDDNYIKGLWIDIDEDYIWLKSNHYKGKNLPKQESDFFRIDKKTLELTRYNVKGEFLESRQHRPFDWKNTLDTTEYDFCSKRIPSKTIPNLSEPNAKTITSIVAPLHTDKEYPKFNSSKPTLNVSNTNTETNNQGFLSNYEYKILNEKLYIVKVIKMEKKMIVPEGVYEINPNAFCTEDSNILKEVILPSTLEYIGSEVFKNCTSLETVDLSKTNINLLQLNVFQNSGVKNILFPKSLKILKVSAISQCKNIKKLEFPGVEEICSYAISECENLQEIVLPKAKKIEYSSVIMCMNLKVVKVPRSCEIQNLALYSFVKIEYLD